MLECLISKLFKQVFDSHIYDTTSMISAAGSHHASIAHFRPAHTCGIGLTQLAVQGKLPQKGYLLSVGCQMDN